MKREPTEYDLNVAMRLGLGMMAFLRFTRNLLAFIGFVYIAVHVARYRKAHANTAAVTQPAAQHVKSARHAKPRHAAVEDETYGQDDQVAGQ